MNAGESPHHHHEVAARTRVRALPGVAEASGRRSEKIARSSSAAPKVIAVGGAPGLVLQRASRRQSALQPAHARLAGSWPSGRGRGRRSTLTTAEALTTTGRRRVRSGSSRAGAEEHLAHLRRGEDRRRLLRSVARPWRLRLPRWSRCCSARRGSSTPSLWPLRRGYHARGAGARDPPAAARTAQVRTGKRRPSRPPRTPNGFLSDHPGLPARLRRRRAVRRKLRDRQHAVDHDRSAHARARHAAHARSDPQAGAPLRDARSARDRPARLRRGTVPGARPRQGPELPVRLIRHRPAAGVHGLRHSDDRGLAGGGCPDHRARRPASRDPRHACAADRCGAGGGGAAAVALRALRALCGAALHRCSARADARGPVRRVAVDHRPAARNRPRRRWAVRGSGDARQDARAAARCGLGWPAARIGGARRAARARERDAQPRADRNDRVRADDRARARDARLGARSRA